MRSRHTAGTGAARFVAPLLFPVLILFSASCSEEKSPVAEQLPERNSTPDSTWTYIVYDAADGTAVDIYDNYILGQTMRSSRYVNLIGLRDSEDTEGILWRIDEQNSYVPLDTLGEVSTGSEQTLYDLVMYAKDNYPADRYIIAFYGHGSAYYGCCHDETSSDALRLHEIRSALTRTGGVDMVLFTAPCIMGCVEMAYELRSCTDIVMGSEEVSCFIYWQYSLEDAFSVMHTDPVTSPSGIAEYIIDRMPVYMPQYAQYGSDTFLTMSAVRTCKVEALRQAIGDLAIAYLADTTAFEALVDLHFEHLTTFGGIEKTDDFLVDINSLVQHFLLTETDANIRSILQRILDRLGEAVFAECHSYNFADATGLSIFLPQSDFHWLSFYKGEKDFTLEFARDTNWDELVSVLVEATQFDFQGLYIDETSRLK